MPRTIPFAIRMLLDPPAGSSRDSIAYMMRELISVHTDLESKGNKERQLALYVHGVIRTLTEHYGVVNYVEHSENIDISEWLGDYTTWLAYHPSGNKSDLLKRTILGPMLTTLCLCNPRMMSVSQYLNQLNELPNKKSAIYNKRSMLRRGNSYVPTFAIDPGEKGKFLINKEGQSLAVPIDPETGHRYYEALAAERRGLAQHPLYFFMAWAWGMRLYAHALYKAGLDVCPLGTGLSRDWLLAYNEGPKPLRPYMLTRLWDGRPDKSLTVPLPTYEYVPEDPIYGEHWVMRRVSQHDKWDRWREGTSGPTTVGMLRKITNDCLRKWHNGMTVDDLPVLPEPNGHDMPVSTPASHDYDESDDILSSLDATLDGQVTAE
jgi:hypothetical protein